MMLMVTSGNTVLITVAMVVGLNLGVLSLFAMESVTMAEFFGARTRFTQLALAKEIGGILATAIGPLLAATLTAVTGHWWPLAAMLVGYSLITLDLRRRRSRGPRPRHGPPGRRGMKAVVVHGANDLRIDERPEPVAGPGEVVLDVEWGGICGSDLSYWRHGASGTAALKSPLVLGHEVAGRIAQLGAGVENLQSRPAGHRPPCGAGGGRHHAGPP